MQTTHESRDLLRRLKSSLSVDSSLQARPSRNGLLVAAAVLAVGLSLYPTQLLSQPPEVPHRYRQYFKHYVDRRSISERALNAIGLTNQEVGRSFALIAGISTYPNLPLGNRTLAPAAVDLDNLETYLRHVEFFDEIVVLRNNAVSDENLKYFLQAYFPERLREYPRSRFLFAYSGHGVQDGTRGYLLQAAASSFEDKANAINLASLGTIYRETAEAAHHSLALINSCYSGAFIRRSFGARRLLPREPGAHAITAGGGGELSFSIDEVGPGSVFFEKLLSGRDGRADTQPQPPNGLRGDGIVTVPELYSYLAQEVQLETEQTQHPLMGDLSADESLGSFFFLDRRRQVAAGTIPDWSATRRREASTAASAAGESQPIPAPSTAPSLSVPKGPGERAEPQASARLELLLSPLDAAVYLDGTFLGTARELSGRSDLRLDPGEYHLSVVRPGYGAVERKLVLVAGDNELVRIKLGEAQ